MKKILQGITQNSHELLGACIILTLVILWNFSPKGTESQLRFYDSIRTVTERGDVVIVGIDDKSLERIGAWPWDRDIFAEVVKELGDKGVKAIVFDVLFLEERRGDAAFIEALEESKSKVIIGAKKDGESIFESFLVEKVSNEGVVSALVNVQPNSDGKVRAYPTSLLHGEACVYGLADSAFLETTFNRTSLPCAYQGGNFRYPSTVQTYSLVDVISGDITREQLKDKVVLVGSVSLDLLDHFVSFSGEKIPGVYVHASALTSRLEKVEDNPLSAPWALLLILLYALGTLSALRFVRGIIGEILVMLGILSSSILLAVTAFSFGVEIPAFTLVITTLLSGVYSMLIRFVREKKKNKYIENLFSKYVHKDVLRELLASPEGLHFEGERREASVLFSDLRGFTTLSESLSPEDLTKTLNAYFSAMTRPILEEKGTIDKFIGDAVMAFWNAPLFVANHELHAVTAALSMQDALKDFNATLGTSLAMGIGIHQGVVVVGNVGSHERVNYTILGDTVNLSSRVEGLTKKYGVEIIVTQEVRKKVHGNHILFRKLDIITVKGKNLPTVLYEVMHENKEKLAIIKKYEEAFTLYQDKKFDDATRILRTLVEKGDIPSEKLLERIDVVRHDENFDGIWRFDEK